MADKKIPYNKLSKSGKWYRDNPNSKGAKKKNVDAVKRSTSPAGLKKRSELKRKRTEATKAGKNIKGKDFDHASKKFISPSKNRGKKTGTVGDRNARGGKKT